jgi:hypothetical protein
MIHSALLVTAQRQSYAASVVVGTAIFQYLQVLLARVDNALIRQAA